MLKSNDVEVGDRPGEVVDEPSSVRRCSRRSALGGGLLLGLSAAVGGSLLLPAPAAAAGLPGWATDGGWRFCVNCFVLFKFDDTSVYSRCARTGGPHQAAGLTFNLAINIWEPGRGEDSIDQANWRHCYKCSALYWGLSSTQRCPLGGAHDYLYPGVYLPYQYVLNHDIGQPPGEQDQWRYCFKCAALFYNGYAYQGRYGLCPYDYTYGHTAAGFDYVLPIEFY
jgi:hypothetical protein